MKRFWIKNYACIALFMTGLLTLTLMDRSSGLFLNGLISIGISIVVLGVAYAFDRISAGIHRRRA